MKVLLAHKFFRLTGGTEKYFQDLATILKTHGHQPIPFSLKHPDNPPSPYEHYFLPDLNYHEPSLLYRFKNAKRIVERTLYSWESRQHIEKLLLDHKPDLAHIQSIEHHISPSILHSFRKYRVPIVQSINTYKLVCASYRLYLFDKAEICERCLYGKHYHAVQMRCVKGSLPASFLAMLEMYLHQMMKIYHLVDCFVVSNNFMAEKLNGAGYPKEKIVTLFNPLTVNNFQTSDVNGNHILYFGRLDPEKGVATLIEAMVKLPQLKLIIVGDGIQMLELQQKVVAYQLSNVEFVGPKWGEQLLPYLLGAKVVVVPSVWYEPSPYVIYQALASGKPVIAANIGGISDLITEETGLLFEPGNAFDLVKKVESIAFNPKKLSQMGQAARRWAEQNLDPEIYYTKLIHLYESVLK